MPNADTALHGRTSTTFRLNRAPGLLAILALYACGADSTLPPDATPPTDPPSNSPEPPATPEPPTTPEPPVTPPPITPEPPSTPPPAGPPTHSGIPFGPNVYTKGESSASLVPPSAIDPAFSGLVTAAYPHTLVAKLEAARRVNDRVLLSFAGNSELYRDANGFNFEVWKRRVDKCRGIDISSYIADGTVMGHFIMDEPTDKNNWNGHQVSPAQIDAMAEYSKQIWPDMPAVIRAWSWYLKGYSFKYLDAAWAQYHERLGPIDQFIADNVRDAKASGLELVLGLNVLAGGGPNGLPGYYFEKMSMSASQVRTWGGALLDQPYGCAFLMFRYNEAYFNRPDIKEAMAELGRKARARPVEPCRRS
jgi:hypothetical protein